ncbi:hypothetical protein EON83_28370 [bacterium]|nr:MAG: hypothetical protein EON83_28370 [bacterium]
MRILNKEEFPEFWERRESEYHINDPEKGLYLDIKAEEITGEITSVDEIEAKLKATQNQADAPAS